MQTISVYLNTRASNASFDYWRQKIGSSLFRSKLIFRGPANLTELSEQLDEDIRSQVDAVVSVGGDGTVNTLIQQLAHKNIGLLVIPGGTANDLATELGLERNAKTVIQHVRRKAIKKIDLIKINGRYMATNGGLGLGSNVAERINSIRKLFPVFKRVMKFSGKQIYSFFLAQELMGIKLESYHLRLSSLEFSGQVQCAALLINNQPVLAGKFPIAPMTSNADGHFNVTILAHPTRQALIRCVLRVAQGDLPINDPHFISFETADLRVENLDQNRPAKFFGDGEVFDESENSWKITIEPSALKVYSKGTDQELVDLVNEVTLA
jgi:diacylglycerol kinase (ATP)